jgi:hypothetical protein
MPKHNQPDQEPTPIDCQIFKELANQPLGFFCSAASAAKGRIIQTFYLSSTSFQKFFRKNQNTSEKRITPCFLTTFFATAATKDANYTAYSCAVN